MSDDDRLYELACQLGDAKRKEEEAKALRVKYENEIAALVETGENGSKTVKAQGLKITVKRALSYEADIDAMIDGGKVPQGVVDAVLVVVPETREFSPKAYEALLGESPDMAKYLAEYVTTKPRKVAVSIRM